VTPFETIGVILLMVGAGIFIQRKQILDPQQITAFEIFQNRIGIPCGLAALTLGQDMGSFADIRWLSACLLVVVLVSGLAFFWFRKGHDPVSLTILVMASVYVNAGVYGIPVITLVTGSARYGLMGLLLQVLVIQTVFVSLLTVLAHKEHSWMRRIKGIVTTPLVMFPLVGLALNLLEVQLPPFAVEALHRTGTGASSLALLTVGMSLGGVRFHKADWNRDFLGAVVLKSLLAPCLAFGAGRFLFDLQEQGWQALVIFASAPSAFLVCLLSRQHGAHMEGTIRKLVTVTSLLGLVHLVWIAWVVH
jgi:malonate transporter